MQTGGSSDLKKNQKPRLGESLLQNGLIELEQLEQVLKRQSQVGGQLGSLLIEMGFISIGDLLAYLSDKFGVPGVNLFERNIDNVVLQILSPKECSQRKILPLEADGNSVSLAMVNPQDLGTISEMEFSLGKKIKPVVVPAFMLDAAVKNLMVNPRSDIDGAVLSELVDMERGEKSPRLRSLLRFLVKSKVNDMLLTAGSPPSVKVSNRLKRLAMNPLTPQDCEQYARNLMKERQWEQFVRTNDAEFGITYPEIGRFRVTVYRQRNSISIALRPVSDVIPSLKRLNLPGWLADFALKPDGLIIVSGPAGHGKSTTLSAMVDIINNNRGCNIVTLEDPIEYLHKHKKSNINQREIGLDCPSFIEGLRHVFRQAPDVIVVGEMRDRETFEIALQAANSGHLVLSTVHSDNATSIIERVINMFEPHEQSLIRMMLADSLLLSISQRLIPLKARQGRILAMEKFINSSRMKNLIREGKTHQIRSQMQAGTKDYASIDMALADLAKRGLIKFDEGLVYAEDPQFYRDLSGVASGKRVKKK
jgi:twitching motility protein PilT